MSPPGPISFPSRPASLSPLEQPVSSPQVPIGWWGIEVPVPAGVVPGTEVRLVVDVRSDPKVIPGRVIRLLGDDSLEGTTALVAIEEARVGAAAAAVADGSLRTLVGGL